jgi:membrane protein DedA with SNARE-associated domain
MIPYIRPFASLPCGISHMPFRRFLAAALSGSIVWCAGMLSVGWVLGPRCLLALHLVQSYTIPAICGLLLIIAITVLIQYRVNRYIRFKLSSTAALEDSQEQQNSRDTVEI